MRRKPGDLWVYEYQHGGVAESLTFEVPDFFRTAQVRARMVAADTAFWATELAKRWVSGEVVDLEGVPAGDWEKHLEAQVVALPETLALCRAHTVAGEAQDVTLLANDTARHDRLRWARVVLFRHGGDDDAARGVDRVGGAPEVGAGAGTADEGAPVANA